MGKNLKKNKFGEVVEKIIVEIPKQLKLKLNIKAMRDKKLVTRVMRELIEAYTADLVEGRDYIYIDVLDDDAEPTAEKKEGEQKNEQ